MQISWHSSYTHVEVHLSSCSQVLITNYMSPASTAVQCCLICIILPQSVKIILLSVQSPGSRTARGIAKQTDKYRSDLSEVSKTIFGLKQPRQHSVAASTCVPWALPPPCVWFAKLGSGLPQCNVSVRLQYPSYDNQARYTRLYLLWFCAEPGVSDTWSNVREEGPGSGGDQSGIMSRSPNWFRPWWDSAYYAASVTLGIISMMFIIQ